MEKHICYIIRTLVTTSLVLLSLNGCSSEAKENLEVSPKNILTNAKYPFNYIVPEKVADNSLGFYSGGTTYIQNITNYANIFLSDELSYAHLYFFEPAEAMRKDPRPSGFDPSTVRDTVEIAAMVMPYPAQFDGYLDEYERYFKSIRFLIPKKNVDSDGRIILSGDEIVLKDQKGSEYKVLSGILTFENDLSEPYNQGGFEVTYQHSDGKGGKLLGGRFKLIGRTESVVFAENYFALDPRGVR